MKKGTKLVYKSAKTGKFINKGYYKGHGSTTVSERVPTGRKRQSRKRR